MKAARIIFSLVVLLFLASENVFACSCNNPPTIDESFRDSDAVFFGRVLSVERSERSIEAVFRVETSWKGVATDEVIVRTDTTSCGINFAVGESHYLFLSRTGDVLATRPCARHSQAQEFLQAKASLPLVSAPQRGRPGAQTGARAPNEPTRGGANDSSRGNSGGSSLYRDIALVGTSAVLAVGLFLLAGFFLKKIKKGGD